VILGRFMIALIVVIVIFWLVGGLMRDRRGPRQ
jgi:hypothetical protein